MKTVYDEIYEKAKPYLDTRQNDVHVRGSYDLCLQLLNCYPAADPDVVLPAIILHDVGWKCVPEEKRLNAYGPNANDHETLRVHEVEGVKIAKEILEGVNYWKEQTEEILAIIEGHDSRHDALSLNDALVKDADKLFRFTEAGADTDCARFGCSMEDHLEDLQSKLPGWFLTTAGKEMARAALGNLVRALQDKNMRCPKNSNTNLNTSKE